MTEFPTFHDVESPVLKVWNRVNTYFNIKELLGQDTATGYLKQFEKPELVAIYITMNTIVIRGYENTRREIFKENQ